MAKDKIIRKDKEEKIKEKEVVNAIGEKLIDQSQFDRKGDV